jgi:hypothetical protein
MLKVDAHRVKCVCGSGAALRSRYTIDIAMSMSTAAAEARPETAIACSSTVQACTWPARQTYHQLLRLFSR